MSSIPSRVARRVWLRSLLGLTMLCTHAVSTAVLSQPNEGAAGSDAALERSLNTLDIPAALRAYDAVASESGPSAELLGRIAWADLRYCLVEGKGWERLEAARALARQGDEEGRSALRDGLNSAHSQVRAGSAKWIAELGIEEAIPRLEHLAQDSRGNPYERVEIAKALYRLGETSIPVRVCADLSNSDQSGVRQLAVRGLAELGDPAGLAALKARLDDPLEATALLAAWGTAKLGDPEGRKRLVDALSSETASVRLLAGWYLGLVGDPRGFEAVEALIQQAFAVYPKVEGLSFKVDAALSALSWIDPVRARPSLEKALSLDKWNGLRLIAGERLAELGEASVIPVLDQIYDDSVGDLDLVPFRQAVVRFAGWLGDRPGVRELARKAATDDHVAVEQVALEVLARFGATEALPPLRRLLGGPDLRDRALAAESVLAFGKGPASPPDRPGPEPAASPVAPGPMGD